MTYLPQLHNKIEDLKGKIRVYVRVRPFSQKERDRGCTEAVEVQGKQCIAVKDPRVKENKDFEFDQVGIPTMVGSNTMTDMAFLHRVFIMDVKAFVRRFFLPAPCILSLM